LSASNNNFTPFCISTVFTVYFYRLDFFKS
jgi:hypothetical protein